MSESTKKKPVSAKVEAPAKFVFSMIAPGQRLKTVLEVQRTPVEGKSVDKNWYWQDMSATQAKDIAGKLGGSID